MPDTPGTFDIVVDADTSRLEREMERAGAAGRRFAATMTGALADVAIKGKSLEDVFRSIALSLSRMALNAALRPIEAGLGKVLEGLFSGAVSLAGAGGAAQALPIPFAAGGVIARPVTFPLANGRMGIAGERGAEAILPLARGPDGRLGVRADGGGAMQITLNVTTPDAESFRRSEAQLATMLARVVGRGQGRM
jgi:phage-related minor tail protein